MSSVEHHDTSPPVQLCTVPGRYHQGAVLVRHSPAAAHDYFTLQTVAEGQRERSILLLQS
eukprot:1977103-Rhodomonas_salina.2